MSSVPPGPPTAEYGADEIPCLVLDPGSSVIRAGFAGEDTPKSVIPTSYGVTDDGNPLFGENALHNPKANFEIRNPMSTDGVVEDWDTAAKLFEYSMTSRLTFQKSSSIRDSARDANGDGEDGEDEKMEDVEENEKPLSETPLLVTEPGWNPTKNRERAIELALEDWDCPAFFLGRSSVLAAFSAGKASALVFDIGARQASVTPVNDGLMLRKGVQKSLLAGDWLSDQLRIMFAQSQPPVPLTAHFQVSSKSAVDAGQPPQATYKTFNGPIHESFKRLQEERVLAEFKETCVQVWYPPNFNGNNLAASTDWIKQNLAPGRSFEMPDGWNNVFDVDRFKAAEGLFDEKAAYSDSTHPAPTKAQTITGLAQAALSAVDVDIRNQLLGNLVVVGGSTQIHGFTDRLEHELRNMYQGAQRVKATAHGNPVERRFAPWIGGSILASLGTFHQMWISKKEYDEAGPSILEKRCK